MKTHPSNSTRKKAAFSLIETLVATGVIATALTGSLGMMAVGLGQSQDSIERTRSAMLAQQIAADLRAVSPSESPAPQDNRYTRGIMPLAGPSFDGGALVFDAQFRLLETAVNASGFSSGSSDPAAAFVVTIQGAGDPARVVEVPVDALDRARNVVADHAPLGGRRYDVDASIESRVSSTSPFVDISRTVITVETPAAAPRSARRTYRYEFLRHF